MWGSGYHSADVDAVITTSIRTQMISEIKRTSRKGKGALWWMWDVVVVESCRSKKWLWRSLVQLGKFSRLAVQSNIDTQLLGGGVGDRILKFAVFGLLALSLVCRGVPDERTTFVTDNPAGHGICRRTLIPDIFPGHSNSRMPSQLLNLEFRQVSHRWHPLSNWIKWYSGFRCQGHERQEDRLRTENEAEDDV